MSWQTCLKVLSYSGGHCTAEAPPRNCPGIAQHTGGWMAPKSTVCRDLSLDLYAGVCSLPFHGNGMGLVSDKRCVLSLAEKAFAVEMTQIY